jgi:hypothetical protein
LAEDTGKVASSAVNRAKTAILVGGPKKFGKSKGLDMCLKDFEARRRYNVRYSIVEGFFIGCEK